MTEKQRQTEQLKAEFLHYLAETGGNVLKSCKLSGLPRNTAFRHKEKDSAFAEKWDKIASGENQEKPSNLDGGNGTDRAAEKFTKAYIPDAEKQEKARIIAKKNTREYGHKKEAAMLEKASVEKQEKTRTIEAENTYSENPIIITLRELEEFRDSRIADTLPKSVEFLKHLRRIYKPEVADRWRKMPRQAFLALPNAEKTHYLKHELFRQSIILELEKQLLWHERERFETEKAGLERRTAALDKRERELNLRDGQQR